MRRQSRATLALAACDGPGWVAYEPADGSDTTTVATDPALTERLDALDAAVGEWRDAATLPEAKAAAEAVRNLVVGPAGPWYGDADGDGTVAGASDVGLLPGLGGERGLAQAGPVNACVEADVLGGPWDEPLERWDEAAAVYEAWSRTNNTMPTLPSHPQRVVGWAGLALGAESVDEAREYAGHAQLHVDVTRRAVEECGV